MSILIIGTFLFIVVIILEAFLKEKRKGRVELKYNTVNSIMNKTEKEFFYVLNNTVQNQYYVFSKVRLLDIFTIPKYLNYRHKRTLKNYIQSKHVDFLLCDKETLKPLIAIELDGKSHLSKKRKERDELIDEIYKSANMKLVHVPISDKYDINNILMKHNN